MGELDEYRFYIANEHGEWGESYEKGWWFDEKTENLALFPIGVHYTNTSVKYFSLRE